jgi:hypothetical protein
LWGSGGRKVGTTRTSQLMQLKIKYEKCINPIRITRRNVVYSSSRRPDLTYDSHVGYINELNIFFKLSV